jgi:RNA polymerase sigma factor (sigma-70 family)
MDLAPPMTADPDEVLMEALAAGRDAALNPLMERWQAPLRGFLFRYTQNEADAEDLAQETFVRIYQHRARFRTGARFSTWMFQIALNLARSRARWQRRRPTDSFDDPGANGRAEEPSAEADPSEGLLARERSAAVRAAIAALPADLRAAVILAEYQGKSHAEAAEIARTTAKAIETRLYRARQALRKTLQRYLRS